MPKWQVLEPEHLTDDIMKKYGNILFEETHKKPPTKKTVQTMEQSNGFMRRPTIISKKDPKLQSRKMVGNKESMMSVSEFDKGGYGDKTPSSINEQVNNKKRQTVRERSLKNLKSMEG